jgi:hypothetical protein
MQRWRNPKSTNVTCAGFLSMPKKASADGYVSIVKVGPSMPSSWHRDCVSTRNLVKKSPTKYNREQPWLLRISL